MEKLKEYLKKAGEWLLIACKKCCLFVGTIIDYVGKGLTYVGNFLCSFDKPKQCEEDTFVS